MYPGLTMGAIAALLVHGTPEQKKIYRAEDGRRRMDRHHEPDRAAMRHRSRPARAPRRCRRPTAATRSPAPRSSSRPASTTSPTTSSIWCSPASRARRPASRASRCSSCRNSWSNADGTLGARNGVVLRLDRAQDGHPRQFDLRDELRRRHRLADRRGEQGPAAHVRDDERGAPRRRRAGPGAVRGRLPERRRLCPRAPAGPLADGRRRRPTSRPTRSSCIPTCAARCSTIRAFNEAARALRAVDRAEERRRAIAPTTRRTARRPTITWA